MRIYKNRTFHVRYFKFAP